MISKWGRFGVAVAGSAASAAALAERYNLQAPQTVIAREIYDLHTLIFLICCVIFVVVFGALFYAFFKHRMREENAVFAGEVSAHYYFREFTQADSGVVPFLLILELISKRGRKL